MISVDGYKIPIKFFPDGTLNLTDLGGDGPFTDMAKIGPDTVASMQPAFTIVWEFEDIVEQVVLWNIVSHLRDKCMGSCIHVGELEGFLAPGSGSAQLWPSQPSDRKSVV